MEDFNDVMVGPWMDLWDIQGPGNRHTLQYLEEQAAKKPAKPGKKKLAH